MLKIGTILGERYEIVEEVGAGGMADVYKAKDNKLNRNVAIKVMKQEFSQDGTFITKFRSEAQAAAGLTNPNIVSVYDVGEDGGNYYIVMELVDGITLKDYISKKGKLSVREATSIAIQVAMGLEAAHAQNIIHRDIKPQNIMISTDGKVKVTDFGIARAASSNTISANAMGSVHYSSPEQVRGGYADLRSDVYSLGISLYEMVTGRVPYDGDTTVAIAIKHLQDEMEPPSRFTPDLPRSLEQIIYKCTQKGVDRRYQNMSEVIEDLKQSLVDPDGDFVRLSPLSTHAETIAVTPEEQAQIREQDIKVGPAPDMKTYGSTSEAKRDYGKADYDDEDDDDFGGISGGLEKAMTIGGFIVGALIICVLIYFVGKAAGLFNFGRNSHESDPVESVISHEEPATESETAQNAVEVPAIVGRTEEAAEEAAKAVNLGIKYMGEKASSDYAEGLIMEQDPVAGTLVEEHTTITYYKSSGSETIAVPDIIGKSISDAQSMLAGAGFSNVVITQAVSEDIPVGNVMSVSPGVGVQSDAASQITVTVSTGPEPTATPTPDPTVAEPNIDTSVQITVRSYTGLTQEVATNAAQSDGLTVRISYGSGNTVELGEVLSQSLNEGDVVPGGQEIVFTINDPDKAAEQEAQQQAAANQAVSEAQNQSPAAAGVWSTNSILGAPNNYTGGAYRLILSQSVNGATAETTILEGNNLEFPYTLICNGASGVANGTVILYEEVNGSYLNRASWPVEFTQAG